MTSRKGPVMEGQEPADTDVASTLVGTDGAPKPRMHFTFLPKDDVPAAIARLREMIARAKSSDTSEVSDDGTGPTS
jgi:hypothetical protein